MEQIDLIERRVIGRAAARKAAMEAAKARADLGIDRVASKADRICAGWCGMALHKLRDFASQMPSGAYWTIEAARELIEPELPKVHDGRAWGAVVVMAIKRGYIVKTTKTAPAASSNNAPKPMFSRGPNAVVIGAKVEQPA